MSFEKEELLHSWRRIAGEEGKVVIDDKKIQIFFNDYRGRLRDKRSKYIDDYVELLMDDYPYLSVVERLTPSPHIEITLKSTERAARHVYRYRGETKVPEKLETPPFERPEYEDIVTPSPPLLLNAIKKILYKNRNNISKTFTGTEIIPRTSTSDTILMKGQLNLLDREYPCMLKLAFAHTLPYDNREDVESDIYKTIIPSMTQHTPHVLDFYGYYPTHKIALDSDELKEKFDEAYENIQEQDVYKHRMRALFLQRSDGKTFIQSFRELTKRGLYTVLFQVMYTLMVFERYHMIHNDLHASNVLVEYYDQPKVFYYSIDGKRYRLETRIFARIFDFDRSRVYNPLIARNLEMDEYYCEYYDTCNKNTVLDDVHNILLNVEDYYIDEDRKKVKFLKYSSINEYVLGFLNSLKQYGILREVDYNPIYVYKAPPFKEIQIGEPTLVEIEPSPIDISTFKENKSTPTYMNMLYNVSKVWDDECKTVFAYKAIDYEKILKEAYKLRFDKVVSDAKENEEAINAYIDAHDSVMYYLSFPMFYKLSEDILDVSLTENELAVLKDISFFFDQRMPIKVPLI